MAKNFTCVFNANFTCLKNKLNFGVSQNFTHPIKLNFIFLTNVKKYVILYSKTKQGVWR